MIVYLSFEISKIVQENPAKVVHPEDNNVYVLIKIDNEIIQLNKFLIIQAFEKLFIYEWNIINQ
jgi:hypothetical protein